MLAIQHSTYATKWKKKKKEWEKAEAEVKENEKKREIELRRRGIYSKEISKTIINTHFFLRKKNDLLLI